MRYEYFSQSIPTLRVSSSATPTPHTYYLLHVQNVRFQISLVWDAFSPEWACLPFLNIPNQTNLENSFPPFKMKPKHTLSLNAFLQPLPSPAGHPRLSHPGRTALLCSPFSSWSRGLLWRGTLQFPGGEPAGRPGHECGICAWIAKVQMVASSFAVTLGLLLHLCVSVCPLKREG